MTCLRAIRRAWPSLSSDSQQRPQHVRPPPPRPPHTHILSQIAHTLGAGEDLGSSGAPLESPLTFEAPTAASPSSGGGSGGSGGGGAAGARPIAGAGVPGQQPLQLAQPLGLDRGVEAKGPPDLSTLGPLRLAFVAFVAGPAAGGGGAPTGGGRVPAAGTEGGKPSGGGGGGSLAGKEQLGSFAGQEQEQSSLTALLEAHAVRSTPDNTDGCSVPGWPLRWVTAWTGGWKPGRGAEAWAGAPGMLRCGALHCRAAVRAP